MISTPRVIEFELLVIDWALDMLDRFRKEELLRELHFKRISISFKLVKITEKWQFCCITFKEKRYIFNM
jgi:hypothetical protein